MRAKEDHREDDRDRDCVTAVRKCELQGKIDSDST